MKVLALALIVAGLLAGSAVGAAAPSTLYVSTYGSGSVTSSPPGINCGNDCQQSYAHGTQVTLTATPASGWGFDAWDGACYNDSPSCTLTINDDLSTNATFEPIVAVNVTGTGKVTGSGFDCGMGGSTCSQILSPSKSITLTATPGSGSTFSGWSGACSGSGTCTFVVGQPRTVNATFTATQTAAPALTVSVAGSGTVTSNPSGVNCTSVGGSGCSVQFAAGTSVTLTQSPGSGANFGGWGGSCSGSAGTCVLTMDASKSASALFSGTQSTQSTFPLQVSTSGSGTVTGGGINCHANAGTCSQNEPAGTSVTLTASPDSGASFSGWSGSCSGTAGTCVVTMDANKSAAALFSGAQQQSAFPLEVNVSGSGTVTGGGINCHANAGTCSQNEPAGTSVTLAASPDSGVSFGGWSGACSGTSPTCTVQMSAARAVGASFAAASATTVSLTLTVSGHGQVQAPAGSCSSAGGTTSCTQQYSSGQTVTLTAVPATGQHFVGWSGACTGSGPCTLPLSSSRAVTAEFAGEGGSGFSARSIGRPLSTPAGNSCNVTVRFDVNQDARAELRALSGSRVVETVLFSETAGLHEFGALNLAVGGYTLELQLTSSQGSTATLHWRQFTCGAFAPPKLSRQGFRLAKGAPEITRVAAGWLVKLHFTTSRAATAQMRVTLGRTLLSDFAFNPRAGAVTVGPFVFARAGIYRVTLVATDAAGVTRSVRWALGL